MFKHMGIVCLLLSCCLLMPARAGADTPVVPRVAIPLMQDVPTIEGRIDEQAWSQAMRIEGLMRRRNHRSVDLEPREATAWIGSDGRQLYLAVRTELPPVGDLLQRVRPDGNRDMPMVFRDDSLELWIAPGRADRTDTRMYQIAVNAHGAVYDMQIDPRNVQQTNDMNWRVAWDFASDMSDGYWDVQLAIPLDQLGVTAADLGEPWGIRIGRNWQQPSGQTEWAPRIGSYTDRDTMVQLQWLDCGPLVRMLGLRGSSDQPGVAVGLEVVNRCDQPHDVRVFIEQRSADNAEQVIDQTVRLQPHAREVFTISEPMLQGDCWSNFAVTSADGSVTYFTRSFGWQVQQPQDRWTVVADEMLAVRLDFGYYPYYDKLKARLDLSGLSEAAAVTGARVQVRKAKQPQVIAQGSFEGFKDARSELVIDMPPLDEGDYEVVAMLDHPSASLDPIVRTFERKVFEWEHNDLGITDKVMPPFTPLVVEDRHVAAVLRDHRMTETGLWEQVTADGRDVLAGSMVFDVRIGGQDRAVEVIEPTTITRAQGHEVDYRARWRAGSVTATITGRYEVDGMLKLVMDLKQVGDEPVERLDLVIPIDERIASLMHVTTTGLRSNYAGYLPQGDGLIWESKQASRRALLGTFVPYVWIGSETRGLSWFADSDRDWLYDDVTSTHRIYRENGQVVLKISFVTKPGPLKRNRQIVFGLQATPTKPMPGDPVHWRNWVQRVTDQGKNPDHWDPADVVHWRNWVQRTNRRFGPNTYTHIVLAGSSSWGTLGHNGFVYPRDQDYAIYDLMRDVRQTGRRDLEREQRWLGGYDQDSSELQSWTNHIRWGMRNLEGQPDAAVPYTNARGLVFDDAFFTFQDEWLTAAYTDRRWPRDDPNAGMAYSMTPTRSFTDYQIWYFKKMLETWADAIYYDCTYLQYNQDIITGAYVADDGTLRPVTDLFAMRDHLKRIQTLTWQLGRNWLASVSHMTNTQIAPINTWAGINLEWEMRYSMQDFQDRFSRDMIRTTAIGSQTGSVPLVLGTTGIRGQATPQRQAFIERTLVGTSLVHEIKNFGTRGLLATIYQILFDFGYGRDDCAVYRYWDEELPLAVTGIDAEPLLLVRDGKALLLLTSFDDSGKAAVQLDAQRLGLSSGGRFHNEETGEPIASTGPAAFEMELLKHDFCVIGYR